DDLYLNEGGKHFRRIEGSHFGSIGRDTYKGMNATIADFDRSGTPDIHVSNVHAPLQAEGSLLWMTERSKNGVVFHNEAAKRGALNEHRFGWGAGAADLDLDGWPDMVQANGMVDDHMDRRFSKPRDYWYVNGQIARSDPGVHAYADRWGDMRGYTIWGDQANRVLLNRGGTFHEAAEITGLTRLGNTRGVALADFDNDGDADLVLTRQFDSVLFYKNHRSKPGNWVGFAVCGDGTSINRDAVGAVLEITQGGQHWHQDVLNVTGFTAQGDRRIVVGLANDPSPVKAAILWPDGSRQDLGTFESGAYHAIRKVTPVPSGEAADAR
ncbi:MAG: CRTAC1 family protein, partial [Verrucomicrobiaceae bacterium]